MKFKLFLLSITILSFTACTNDSSSTSNETEATVPTKEVAPKTFADSLELAHKKADFLSHKAIQFDLDLKFGGKERMNAKFTVLTNSTAARIDLKDGNTIIYNQDKVYHSDNFENENKIRFDAYTWPYFFLFPYKLSDPGTVWTDFQNNMPEKNYTTKKLSFEANIGDDPDDWYIVYASPENYLIDIAAYIVTANKTVEEAEASPSAIQYLDYAEVNNIPIATTWKFWKWNKEEGLTNEKGEGSLSNIKFLELEDDFFDAPEGFKEK